MTVALTQSGGAAVQAGSVLSLQQPAGDGLPFRARLRLDLPLLPGTMALALHTGSRSLNAVLTMRYSWCFPWSVRGLLPGPGSPSMA